MSSSVPPSMPSSMIDARATRFDNGVVALVILAGFVFVFPWAILVVAVTTALGAALGPDAGPIVRGYTVFALPQMRPPEHLVDRSEWRFAKALEAGALGFAALVVPIGLAPVAWLVALGVAGVCALDATTGISVGAWVSRRRRRRPR